MADDWLCFVTREKIFGINLRNLIKFPDSWSCLPTLNSDFYSGLPSPGMCPFVFDSNIYMAAGYVDPKLHHPLGFPPQFPPNTVYEFRLHSGKKRKQLQSGETHQQLQPGETHQPLFSPLLDSFSPAPIPFLNSYLTNISGDVYLYVDPTRLYDAPESMYVLRSGSKEWEPLPPPPSPSPPPPEEEESWGIHPSGMFVLHDKLFLASIRIGSPYLVSFNPGEQSWMVETDCEKKKKNVSWLSFHSRYHMPPELDHMPELQYISIPYFSVILQDPSLSVAFSYSYHPCIRELDRPTTAYIKLTALLLDQNGGVISYQHIDQCFEGIQPKIHSTARFHLVDLGQGKLCAVLYGSAMENAYSPVLCISIFTPSLVEDFAALHTDSSLVEEQTFLSLTVHSKSVYNVKDWWPDPMEHAFVWPPPKGASFHHRTTAE